MNRSDNTKVIRHGNSKTTIRTSNETSRLFTESTLSIYIRHGIEERLRRPTQSHLHHFSKMPHPEIAKQNTTLVQGE